MESSIPVDLTWNGAEEALSSNCIVVVARVRANIFISTLSLHWIKVHPQQDRHGDHKHVNSLRALVGV